MLYRLVSSPTESHIKPCWWRHQPLRKKEQLTYAKEAPATALAACDAQAQAFQNDPKGFAAINNSLSSIFNILQETDMPATAQSVAAANNTDVAFKVLWAKWEDVKKRMKNCLGQK